MTSITTEPDQSEQPAELQAPGYEICTRLLAGISLINLAILVLPVASRHSLRATTQPRSGWSTIRKIESPSSGPVWRNGAAGPERPEAGFSQLQ